VGTIYIVQIRPQNSQQTRPDGLAYQRRYDRAPRVEDDLAGGVEAIRLSPKRPKTRVQTEQDHVHSKRSRENPSRIPRLPRPISYGGYRSKL